MIIKITTKLGTKEISLQGVKISLTDLKIGEDIFFKDILEISFNENDFIMQMVDAIKDCCILTYQEFGNEIELSTYKSNNLPDDFIESFRNMV